MKIVALSEAKAKLSHYARLCHRVPVVVTVHGSPDFQLVPLEQDDDLIDRLLAEHPGFRKMLAARLKEPEVSARAARKRL